MGCSNPHPHGQIWTITGLPEEPAAELEQLQKYRREQGGSHMLEDYATLEATMGERIVFENGSFMALCPWWAVWPFEVMIVSKLHRRAIVEFSDEEKLALAETIAEVTRRYDNLFETQFPYSMGLHQAPLEGTQDEIDSSHFHIHFYPPLLRSATVRKFLVGFVFPTFHGNADDTDTSSWPSLSATSRPSKPPRDYATAAANCIGRSSIPSPSRSQSITSSPHIELPLHRHPYCATQTCDKRARRSTIDSYSAKD